MNAVDLLRFFKGYVSFSGEGGFTERFINLCSFYKITIWNVSYNDGRFFAECRCSDYRKLRSISRKSGVRIRLQSRHGLYTELQKRNRRKGLIIGGVFFMLYFAVMSNFIWSIDAESTDVFSKDELLASAEAEGLHTGTFKPFFDETKAANSIAQNNSDSISWAAINIRGSRAVIEVRRKEKSIKTTEDSFPCNIVSDFDGVVISAEVFNGIGNVSNGIAVKKGDLLISGALQNEDFSVSFVEADGRITAKRSKSFSMSFMKNRKVKTFSHIKTRRIPELFGIKISLPESGKSTFSEMSTLSYNNVELPLKLITLTQYKTKEAEKSDSQFFLSAVEEFSNESYKLNKNTLLLCERFTVKESDKGIFFSNNWSCIDFMGQKQKIIIEN